MLASLDEAFATARRGQRAGRRSRITSAPGPHNWGRTVQTLAHIDAARARQPIGLDAYPYIAGSTVLRTDLVDGIIDVIVTWSKPHPEMAARHLADIAAEWGCTQQEACERLQPGGACYFQMREDDVQRVLHYPATMIGSDGLPHDQHPHPRLWGTFPRVLGHYSRDLGLFPLEDGGAQDDGAFGATVPARRARRDPRRRVRRHRRVRRRDDRRYRHLREAEGAREGRGVRGGEREGRVSRGEGEGEAARSGRFLRREAR